MQELQGLNQVLRDEHQALQLAFSALEEKLRKCQVCMLKSQGLIWMEFFYKKTYAPNLSNSKYSTELTNHLLGSLKKYRWLNEEVLSSSW